MSNIVPKTPRSQYPVSKSALSYKASDVTLDALTVAAKVATSPKDVLFSGIRLIRAATARRFSEQLRAEWTKYVDEGKIKPDYADTDQARTIFADTLESLGDANFDQEQLDLLRRLFIAAASETVNNRHDILVREYLAVGRTLATGEIRVQAAYYRYLPEWETAKDITPAHSYSAHQSIDVIRKHSGLMHTALIQRHERSLIDKGLVLNYRQPGMPEVDPKHYRLTDFGYAFCEFLQAYDRMKGA